MSQKLIEELFTEINANVDLGSDLANPVEASFDLSAKYDELRRQAAAIDGKYTDLRIDVDAIKRSSARMSAEMRDRVESLEANAKGLLSAVHELNDSQVQNLRSLIQAEDLIKAQGDRLSLLEAKMERAAEVITAHERSIIVMKKQRLTITSIALIAIAIAVWGHLWINAAADINAVGRLNNVERILGIQ
jgi:chromosome segregation ATPase